MLALYSTFIATKIPGPFGQPNNYTLFADDTDTNTFYILPEYPNYLETPGSTPGFAMIWYAGGGVENGGILTFTVALQMPNAQDKTVRTALNDAIHGNAVVKTRAQQVFQMAKDNADGNKSAADRQRLALGLTEDRAQKYYDAFVPKGDYTQFLPTGDGLVIKPVPVTSGSVTIRGFNNPELFKTWDEKGQDTASFTGLFETTPSYLNDNAAVISFSLNSTGVNLFWHALGGPKFSATGAPKGYDSGAANSVVAVEYTVGFDAMLPAATAVVTLDKSKVASYIKKTTKDTWGHTKTTITKKYNEDINSSIEISLPSSSYLNTASGKESVRDSLQSWAQTQLESMLQSQLPDIPLDKLGGGDVTDETINEIQNQSRSYKLSEAIDIQKRPQGQLPMVGELLKGGTLNDYFSVLDLNHTPFINVDVTVNPPAQDLLQSRGVRTLVVTQMTYGDNVLRSKTQPSKEVHTVEFPSNAATEQVQLIGSFGKKSLTNDLIDYSYMVTYEDGTAPYRVNNVKVKTAEQGFFVSIPAVHLGVLYAKLDGTNLPWGILERVRVEVKYEGLYAQNLVLTGEVMTATVMKPIGQPVDKPLQYKVTMYLKGGGTPFYYPIDGSSYSSQSLEISHNIAIESGLGSGGLTNYVFQLDDPAVDRALLRVSYKLPLVDEQSREFADMLTLDRKSAQSVTWSVPSPATGYGQLTITKARTYDAEGDSFAPTLETIDPSTTQILIGLKTIPDF